MKNEDGYEVRLITINELCSTCYCNKGGFVCGNTVKECNGVIHNTNCPVWTSLTDILALNVR